MRPTRIKAIRNWYVSRPGGIAGPFSATKLLEMLWEGRLSLLDWLMTDPKTLANGTMLKYFADVSRQFELEGMLRGQRRLGLPRQELSGGVVVRGNGESAVGDVTDISLKGIAIWLEEDLFAVGDVVTVTVRSPVLEEEITLDVEIRRTEAALDGLRYGCSIVASHGDAANVIYKFMMRMIAGAALAA